ncbi:MAG: ABC transporter ATP-binding protein [Bryobacterales bacterium]|nr:ABC transporter ATP-binding protein [Bryobacterales bacterium]
MQSAIEVRAAGRRFDGYVALENINLTVKAGTFVSLVGPSGCGKSTLLNLIAGLLTPTAGSVLVFGEPLRGLNRRAAYMFQQDALLPWKTVSQNIALGLELRGEPSSAKTADWVRKVGLDGFADHYPHQLSGGMRKRVAMAQVFITDPAILLMDEPFSALDVHTRHRMEAEALALWQGTGKTVLFVTHDLEEAISLSDEVVLLSAGPGSRIAGQYSIDLPRPRNLLDMKTDHRFQQIYNSIWQTLRTEVLKTHE